MSYPFARFTGQFFHGALKGEKARRVILQDSGMLFKISDSWSAELYADFNARPEDEDRSTIQAFVGWKKNEHKVGLQFVHQKTDTPTEDRNLDVFSVFGIVRVHERLAAIARFDRLMDPNPEGEKIPYIPFAANAKANFFLAAVDFTIVKNVYLQPNLEFVQYDEPESREKPDSDVISKITLFFKF